ncbi:MAG: hypothetical protein RLZZ393_577 [Pseudomonadota bacterium]
MKERLQTKAISDVLGVAYTERLKEAFPDVDPGIVPMGYLLVLQLRSPVKKTKGGILLADDTRDADKYRTQTALVRSMGPSAFRRRDTLEPWPEGDWCAVGDFVRAPMYGGDRWAVKIEGNEDALFIAIKDTDLIGLVTADPLGVINS